MTEQVAIWRMRGTHQETPVLRVEVADSFLRRFLGLMGRKCIEPSRALLLSPCSSVHMCFMSFSIDVIYLKREKDGDGWETVKVERALYPWIGFSACQNADAVLEMKSGEAERLGVQEGTVWDEVGDCQ